MIAEMSNSCTDTAHMTWPSAIAYMFMTILLVVIILAAGYFLITNKKNKETNP